MENKVKDLRQQLLNFKFNKSFNKNDFFVSDSNFYVYNFNWKLSKFHNRLF